MHLWIVRMQEPLPTPDGRGRVMRAGQLALMAAARGWRVTWWTSPFDHYGEGRHPPESVAFTRALGVEPVFLRTVPYRRAVSPARFLHDLLAAVDFLRRAPDHDPPDVALVSLPTVELTAATVALGRRRGFPVAVDVRDIWPDLWPEMVPRPLAPAVRLMVPPWRRLLERALARADALFACGEPALRWALERAGRGMRDEDGVFYHAFPRRRMSEELAREAAAFWEERGVTLHRPPGERLRLVFAGTLSVRAGCLAFLRQFRTLPGELRRSVRVVVVGRGPEYEAIRRLAAEEPSVSVFGWVDWARLHVLYQRVDAGLLPYAPTRDAGWIMVNKFGEYLLHGLPVLTTLGEEVGVFVREHGCGLQWDRDRPDGLRACLEELVHSPSRLRELRRAARDAGRLFEAERVYGAMLDRLERLARRRGDGGP